jgi:hypothetical protein
METDVDIRKLLEISVKAAYRVQFFSNHFVFGTVQKVLFVAFHALYSQVSLIKTDEVVK